VTDDAGGRGVRIGAWRLMVPAERMPPQVAGTEVIFGIRPEKLSGTPQPGGPTLGAEVVQVEPLGAETIFAVRIPEIDRPVFARVGPDVPVKVGDRLVLGIDLSAAHLFDAQGDALHP
jgi:ABC-type sugar transport system ATPase subunit